MTYCTYICSQALLSADDWRKQLLDAVEKILDQEREILSAAMAATRPGAPPSVRGAGDVGGGAGDVGSGAREAVLDCYRLLVEQVRWG